MRDMTYLGDFTGNRGNVSKSVVSLSSIAIIRSIVVVLMNDIPGVLT